MTLIGGTLPKKVPGAFSAEMVPGTFSLREGAATPQFGDTDFDRVRERDFALLGRNASQVVDNCARLHVEVSNPHVCRPDVGMN